MTLERTLQLGVLVAVFATQALPPLSTQTGTVTGVIRTVGGAPAANVRVTALRAEVVDDALRAMASLTQTDATGHYVLANVPPGQYYITAGRVDLPTYYPGTLELSKGTTVSIASAGTIANIDFVVQDTSTAAAPAGLGLRGRGGAVAIAPITVLPNLNIQGGRRGGAAALGAVTVAPAGPRAVIIAPDAAWWTNPGLVLRMGVTEEQKKRIEAAAERHRPAIEQGKAVLEKEEATLNRILEAEKLEPANVTTAQVERVVLARAQVERVNSVLTLEIREILSRSQWLQLQAETRQPLAAPLVVVPGGRSGARGGGFGPGGTP